MSDRTPTPDPLAALIAELREPVVVDPASRRRVMDAVRRMPAPAVAAREHARRPVHHAKPGSSAADRRSGRALATIRRMRGGAPHAASAGTLATAAGIALLLAVGSRDPGAISASRGGPAVILGDSVASALRDTLRIVQFMLTAPAASRVALAGDFNGWDPRATPLARDTRDGRWAVTLALAPGRHRYAYVVDDTQWVRDPAAMPAEPNELTPPRSVVVVGK